ALPELAVRSSTRGEFRRARTPLRGGASGFLGPLVDPFCVNGEPGTPEAAPALAPPADVPAARLERRAALLSVLEHGGPIPASCCRCSIRACRRCWRTWSSAGGWAGRSCL